MVKKVDKRQKTHFFAIKRVHLKPDLGNKESFNYYYHIV